MRAEHENWRMDNLDTRDCSTGLRIVTQNFERKLLGSVENIEEVIQNMEKQEIDVLVATSTEPGVASISDYNSGRLLLLSSVRAVTCLSVSPPIPGCGL